MRSPKDKRKNGADKATERAAIVLGSLTSEASISEYGAVLEGEHRNLFIGKVKQIINQTMKKRKKEANRAFTFESDIGPRLMFVYAREDDGFNLEQALNEFRLMKIYHDPTFLPAYIDSGIKTILWCGLRVCSNGMIEAEILYDDEGVIESIVKAGSDNSAIPYRG